MELVIDQCVINNPELDDLNDILYNFKIGGTKYVDTITFDTKEKYVNVDCGMTIFNPDYRGSSITITPYIFEDGYDLEETDFERYINHPDYYRLVIVCTDTVYSHPIIIPLKHSYRITFIDDHLISDYTMSQAEFLEFD